jgi:hypothetical protein
MKGSQYRMRASLNDNGFLNKRLLLSGKNTKSAFLGSPRPILPFAHRNPILALSKPSFWSPFGE